MLLVDGHVHLYSNYDLLGAFKIGIENLSKNARKIVQNLELNHNKATHTSIKVLLLTERSDCHFFDQFCDSASRFESIGLKIKQTPELEALLITCNHGDAIYIFAGRQIITAERLEILSLTSNKMIEDRKFTVKEVIEKVNESRGIPVLNWAPGKWFFKRKKVVQQTLEKSSPQQVLIGDTSLRHTLWPEPKLMIQAKDTGFKVIAGSDPLPFRGEENLIGSYGFSAIAEFDPEKPVTSIRKMLRDQNSKVSFMGKRNNILKFTKREITILVKK